MPLPTGLLSAGAKALGWAARHPVATDAGIGAAAGFMTSGFSGWGALAGGIGGSIGGMGSRREYASRVKSNAAEFSSLRSKYRASNLSLREGKAQLGAVERGYRQDSDRFYQAQRNYAAAKRPGGSVHPAQRSGSTWERAAAGANEFGAVNRGASSTLSSRRLNVQGTRAELRAAATARKTSAADLARVRGTVGQAASYRNTVREDFAAASRQRRILARGRQGIRGTSITKGALLGGALGGGAIGLGRIGSAAIGSSFGSQNQNPYGATFSGMGNGTVGGY